MKFLSNHRLASAAVACRGMQLACGVLVVAIAREAVGQVPPPMIRRWSIEATVVDIVDPGKIFSDVRLGDAVRGTLTYDLTLLANPFYSGDEFNNYTNDPWFGVASMVIDNSRGGPETRFIKDIEGFYGDVIVADNWEYDNNVTSDFVFAEQSVLPPAGFQGLDATVAVTLEGPTDRFANKDLPSTLILDQWPVALVAFYGYDDDYDITTYIDAEIHDLTPLNDPLVDGDFDFDGDVDDVDLFGWKECFDSAVLYADADADGDVDGADFLVWQRSFGSIGAPPGIVAVPEPTTIVLWFLAAASRRALVLGAAKAGRRSTALCR
jgi:hypothetical protein